MKKRDDLREKTEFPEGLADTYVIGSACKSSGGIIQNTAD